MKNWIWGAVVLLAVAAGYFAGTRESKAPEEPAAHPGAVAEHPATIPTFSQFSVGSSNVKTMLIEDDILWAGTSGGVIRYEIPHDRYQLLDLKSGLLAKGIFHIGKLGDRLAVGTYGGGLSLLDRESMGWEIYNVPHGLADAFVYDVLEMPDGAVWIATWSGANLVRDGAFDDPKAWETYTVANTSGGLPNDWVYALAAGADGEVWMATEGGLARYLDGTWTNWKHENGLGAPYELVRTQISFTTDPAKYSEHHARQKEEMNLQDVDVAYNPNYIVALLVDEAGTVWCGTWGGGLSRFDGDQWSTITVADGLPANHVFMLHSDREGRLWVGTSNGLARMNESGGFTRYGTEHGLFSNAVFSMAVEPDGSAWIGSFGGVARIQGLTSG